MMEREEMKGENEKARRIMGDGERERAQVAGDIPNPP